MSFEYFQRLGESVGAVVDAKAKTFTLTRGELTFTARFRQNKNIRTLTIECPTQPLPVVYLRKENATDRVGKRIGLNREVQTGHTVFDDIVYPESNASDDAVKKLLSSEQLHAATLLILQNGYQK